MTIIEIIFITDLLINFIYLLVGQPDMELNIKIETNNIFYFIAKIIFIIASIIIFTTFTLIFAWILGLFNHIFNAD